MRYTTRSENISLSRHRYKPPLPVSILFRLLLRGSWFVCIYTIVVSPHSKPSKPISGDGKSHSTNFCDRSIIMQTAVTLPTKKHIRSGPKKMSCAEYQRSLLHAETEPKHYWMTDLSDRSCKSNLTRQTRQTRRYPTTTTCGVDEPWSPLLLFTPLCHISVSL